MGPTPLGCSDVAESRLQRTGRIFSRCSSPARSIEPTVLAKLVQKLPKMKALVFDRLKSELRLERPALRPGGIETRRLTANEIQAVNDPFRRFVLFHHAPRFARLRVLSKRNAAVG